MASSDDRALFSRLMTACAEDPGAVERRLVLADWLLERGDPLGELIQLQCRLEELDEDDPAGPAIAARATQIRRRHQRTWLADLLSPPAFEPSRRAWPPGKDRPEARFRRGLVEHFGCSISQLEAADAELARRLPLRSLTLRQCHGGEEPGALAGSAVIAKVRALSLELDFDDLPISALRALLDGPSLRRGNLRELRLDIRCPAGLTLELVAELPHLRALESLDVRPTLLGGSAGARGGEALGTLRRLRSLSLSQLDPEAGVALGRCLDAPLQALRLQGGIGFDGARALADSTSLSTLRRLSLLDSNIGAAGARALAQYAAERMPALTALDLEGGAIGARGAAALVAAEPLLSRLRELDLSGCRLTPDAVAALVGAPGASAIESLRLGDTNLRGGALAPALVAMRLPSLRRLYLGGCRVGADGARALAETRALRGVRELSLSGNALKDEGAAALAQAANLDSLVSLDLSYNNIGEAGIAAIAAGPLLAGVQRLDLDHNKFRTAGGVALAGCPHLDGLRELVLNYNWMGKRGIRAILGSDRVGELRQLLLGENNYDEAGMAAVAKSVVIDKLERLQTREVDDAAVAALASSAAAESLVELSVVAGVTDEGASALIASPAFGNLERLDLSFCKISEQVQRALRERFGPLVYWGELR